MSVLLEHDDIIKSRRALIISSVVVIALYYVKLESEYIEILKLKVAVSKDSLIIAAKFSTVYLLYIFALQALRRINVRYLENQNNHYQNMTSDQIPDTTKDMLLEALDNEESREERNEYTDTDTLFANYRIKLRVVLTKHRQYDFALEALIEIVPAVVIAIAALTGWHTIFAP